MEFRQFIERISKSPDIVVDGQRKSVENGQRMSRFSRYEEAGVKKDSLSSLENSLLMQLKD